jgi:hypothetical protein
MKRKHCFTIIEGLFVLNILDALLTLASVSSGKAVEVNILPKFLLACGPVVFLVVKIGLVTLALSWAYLRVRSGKWKARIALPIFSVVASLMIVLVGLNVAALVS